MGVYNGVRYETVGGGDTVLYQMESKRISKVQQWMDAPRVLDLIASGDTESDIEVMNVASSLWQKTYSPIYADFFKDKAILEMDSLEYQFDVEIPSESYNNIMNMLDVSKEYGEAPGIGESVFHLYLNVKLNQGDIITPDASAPNSQIIVPEDDSIVEVDGMFKTPFKMGSNSKFTSFDPEFLKAGQEYFIVDHSLGEMSTDYAGIHLGNSSAKERVTFRLSNQRGFEAASTSMANFVSDGKIPQEIIQLAKQEKDKGDIMMVGAMGGLDSGIPVIMQGKQKMITLLEMLTVAELKKREATSLIFAQAMTTKAINGMPKSVNEGVYWQMKNRGYNKTYSRVNGITVDLLADVASVIFAGSDIPHDERRVKFEGGTAATNNVEDLITRHGFQRMAQFRTSGLVGQESLLPQSPAMKGNNLAIDVPNFKISSVYFPGVGVVSVDLNTSLDNFPMQDRHERTAYARGKSFTTHTLMVRDWTDSMFTNALKGVHGATVIQGGNQGANIFYVRPKDEVEYFQFGRTFGRYNPYNNMDVVSALKTQHSEFWIWNRSAAWVRDVTRVILIEIDRETYKRFSR